MFQNGCRVCFKHKDEAPELQFCAQCRYIRYCGPACQKEDWKAGHKLICKHLAAVRRENAYGRPRVEPGNLRAWREFWAGESWRMEPRLNRPLNMAEHFALAGQRCCAHCYYPALEEKPETGDVEECPDCLMVAFCPQHTDIVLQAHAHACSTLDTVRRCARQLYRQKQLEREGTLPKTISPAGLPALQSMPTDWPAYLSQRSFPADWLDVLMRVRTMQLTWPATVLYALDHAQTSAGSKLLDLPEQLTIHLAGAAFTELTSSTGFEEVLHALPHVKQLTVAFVGPEVDTSEWPWSDSVCEQCQSQGRKMSFHASQKLYHKFIASPDKQGRKWGPPDIAMAFNSGLHEDIVDHDCPLADSSWTKTFEYLRDMRVPTYLTAYNANEIQDDEDVLQRLGCQVTMAKHQNPFKCLVPLMDPEGHYQTFYANNFIVGFCGAS